MLRCGGGYRYLRGKFVGRSQRARSSVSVPELALGLAFLLLVANGAGRLSVDGRANRPNTVD